MTPPRRYTDLAPFWPLLSPPAAYADEARTLRPWLLEAADAPPSTLLELGSGAGSLASHFTPALALVLCDRSAEMLAASQVTNPSAEHVLGDMRTLRLGRTFDLVLVHDAVMYAVTADDARATIATAAAHCRSGGGLMVVPDFVAETFEPDENAGEATAPDGRTLHYVERKSAPEPGALSYAMTWDFTLREADGTTHTWTEQAHYALFPRQAWCDWLDDAGIDARVRRDPWGRDVFVGRRRPAAVSG
ncbi:MAG: class I SAM-dependent methyltransferase [Vicinamibacterales bacterium]